MKNTMKINCNQQKHNSD